MKRTILIAALVLCAFVFGGFSMQAQKPARAQWEYKMLLIPNGLEMHDEVQAAGADGWELVSVQYYRPELKGVAYYFKRPKQ